MMAPAGTVLTPGWISLLIAAGWMEVNTVRPPRIRILAVGDELKNPGRALEPGDVFPSAAAGIFAWCRKESATEVRLSLVGDDYYDLQEEMPDSSVADLVITLGGTGRSERDVVINAIDELGADILFRGVQVKPGHYAAFAKLDDMPVVCLPGGPSAAEMMFHVLARRAIHARMGDPGWSFIINYALLEKDIPPRQELDQLVRVAIDYTAEGIVASPLSDLKTHREIAETSGIVLSRAGKELKAGEKVEVWLI
jgi:molybdopterin molybdotransferase